MKSKEEIYALDIDRRLKALEKINPTMLPPVVKKQEVLAISMQDKVPVRNFIEDEEGTIHLFTRYSTIALQKSNGTYRSLSTTILPVVPISPPAVADGILYYIGQGGSLARKKTTVAPKGIQIYSSPFTSKKLQHLQNIGMIHDVIVRENAIVVVTSSEMYFFEKNSLKLREKREIPKMISSSKTHGDVTIMFGLVNYAFLYHHTQKRFIQLQHDDIWFSILRNFDFVMTSNGNIRIACSKTEWLFIMTYNPIGDVIIDTWKTPEKEAILRIISLRFLDEHRIAVTYQNYETQIFSFNGDDPTPMLMVTYTSKGRSVGITRDLHAVLDNGRILPLDGEAIDATEASKSNRLIVCEGDDRYTLISKQRTHFSKEQNIQVRESHPVLISGNCTPVAAGWDRVVYEKMGKLFIQDLRGNDIACINLPKPHYLSVAIHTDFLTVSYRDSAMVYRFVKGKYHQAFSVQMPGLNGASLFTGDTLFTAVEQYLIVHSQMAKRQETESFTMDDNTIFDNNESETHLDDAVFDYCDDVDNWICEQEPKKQKRSTACTIVDFDTSVMEMEVSQFEKRKRIHVGMRALSISYRSGLLLIHEGNRAKIMAWDSTPARSASITLPERITGMDIVRSQNGDVLILAVPAGFYKYNLITNTCSLQAQEAGRYYEEEGRFYKISQDLFETNDIAGLLTIWRFMAGQAIPPESLTEDDMDARQIIFSHNGHVVL